MNNIVIFTSNRSEWGILKPLAIELKKQYNIKIIACASHLSSTYNTFIDIVSEFDCERIENSLDSNTSIGSCKSSGLICISLPDIIERINPDLMMILGDRFESFICSFICNMMHIKILHLHGGEKSGNLDDYYRNCISEFADIHCTATINAYRNLLRKYNNVYYTGCLGCNNLPEVNNDNSNKILIMYHPVTHLYKESFIELFYALYNMSDEFEYNFILANNDFGSKDINGEIYKFNEHANKKVKIHASLDRNEFLDLLSKSLCIIGNSSCGIIEAPSIGIPTINIGSRQKGRNKASSIHDVMCNRYDILNLFEDLKENNFKSDFGYTPYIGKLFYDHKYHSSIEEVINVIQKL